MMSSRGYLHEAQGEGMNHRIFPADQYRDPATVFERAEAKTCAGCGWIARSSIVVRVRGEEKMFDSCGKFNRFGARCRDYTEKKGHD